jgi:hypothetical protein
MIAALVRGIERVAGITAAELGLGPYFSDHRARAFCENAAARLKELSEAAEAVTNPQ